MPLIPSTSFLKYPLVSNLFVDSLEFSSVQFLKKYTVDARPHANNSDLSAICDTKYLTAITWLTADSNNLLNEAL